MEYLGLIIVIVIVVINGIGAQKMKEATVLKGYGDDYHIWAICFWLGIFGYLYAIALPDLVIQSQNQQMIKLLERGGKHFDALS